MQNLKGFLLSYVKYGDHDAVLHCFTEENGFQSFFIRGIYSQKNKKKAYLLPLNELQFTINSHSKNTTLPQISKVELVNNREFYTNVKSNAMVFFVSDFLNQILKLEHKNFEIYQSISEFLDQVENSNYQSHIIFLYTLIPILGFEPLNSNAAFLNPESGRFEDEISHPLFNLSISDLYKVLSTEERSYSFKFNSKVKKDFLDSLLIYYRYHLSDFREPKSLEILQQIFE